MTGVSACQRPVTKSRRRGARDAVGPTSMHLSELT